MQPPPSLFFLALDAITSQLKCKLHEVHDNGGACQLLSHMSSIFENKMQCRYTLALLLPRIAAVSGPPYSDSSLSSMEIKKALECSLEWAGLLSPPVSHHSQPQSHPMLSLVMRYKSLPLRILSSLHFVTVLDSALSRMTMPGPSRGGLAVVLSELIIRAAFEVFRSSSGSFL